MKINFKLISLILILFFISVSAVAADNSTQIDDNNIDDTQTNIDTVNEDENSMTSEPIGFYELQQAIWNAKDGDTILLDNDYIDDGKRQGITINHQVTIDGQGHTMDGNGKDIFFIKEITHVELKNIIFKNGVKKCGGAIWADVGTDYLVIKNCTFINNKATTNSVGGAIIAKSPHTTITDCYFENNYAPSSGGAIRLEASDSTISNNIFIGNQAKDSLGGAINALGHNNKIIGNTFSKNVAGRDGGAIDIEGVKVAEIGKGNIISNNIFDSNYVKGHKDGSHGGAISLACEDTEVSNNTFTNNYAESIKGAANSIGGAIRWNGDVATGKIIGNIFKNNKAQSGGAIYVAGPKVTISNNKFNGDKATGGAGGAINIKGKSATISDNEITKSSSSASGGAIYVEGKSLKLTNNNITGCKATGAGGAAYINGKSATITGNKFEDNYAGNTGGALLIKSSSATISKNDFTKNTAKSSGGAAYIEGATITVSSNVFTENIATTNTVGGAIRFSGNDAKITKNTFTKNKATNAGFAYYGSGENPTISKNTISPKDSKNERWEKTSTKLTTPSKTFKKSAKTKKIVITLKSKTNKLVKGKKIKLTVNKKSFYGTTNSKGKATIKIKLTKKGTFKYTAKFAGDKYYKSKTAKGTIKIK